MYLTIFLRAKSRSLLSLIAVLCLGLAFCASNASAITTATERPNIIFDTDIGSDCDDAGALAILHHLADNGEARILGVMFSSGRNRYGVGVCDAINTYYHRGNLPLGQYQNDDVGDRTDTYSKQIATATNLYHHHIMNSAEDIVTAYKRILANQPDASVTIVTVGHPAGIVHLLRDAEGRRLIERKVARCVVMAYARPQPVKDWNLGQCGADRYTGDLLAHWPAPIFFSDAGENILTGNRKLPATPEQNPVREIFKLYHDCLTKGRPSWDEIAVLYAIRPQYFSVEPGSLQQNKKGETFWTSETSGQKQKQFRVRPVLANAKMASIIEDLMSAPPK